MFSAHRNNVNLVYLVIYCSSISLTLAIIAGSMLMCFCEQLVKHCTTLCSSAYG